MDDEDFLDAIGVDDAALPETEAKEPAPEPEKAPEPEPTPAEALSEPATPTEPAVPTELTKPEPVMVPLAALHETRDELKELKTQLAQFQQAQTQPQQQVPDRDEDPDGYEAWKEQQNAAAILNARLDTFEEIARERFGDEMVKQSQQWAHQQYAANPAYQTTVLSQRNPYAFVISEYQRAQALEKLGDPKEVDAFLAWKQAQNGLTAQQQPQPGNGAAPPNPTSAIPPRSLASAPSAGGINAQVELSEEDIFNEVIPKG